MRKSVAAAKARIGEDLNEKPHCASAPRESRRKTDAIAKSGALRLLRRRFAEVSSFINLESNYLVAIIICRHVYLIRSQLSRALIN